jgi:hypothetical protein
MNREIIFRVWDGTKMYYPCDKRFDTSIVFNEWGWEVFSHFSGKPETLVQSWVNKDAVLMQKTGLVDKLGEVIWEGDILSYDYADHKTEYPEERKKLGCYVVAYEYDAQMLGGVGGLSKLYCHSFRFKHTEKLGNIYEQPKLKP